MRPAEKCREVSLQNGVARSRNLDQLAVIAMSQMHANNTPVLGVQDADAIQMTETMRACSDGGDAASGIVLRRKIKPEELEEPEDGSGILCNAPAVTANTHPA